MSPKHNEKEMYANAINDDLAFDASAVTVAEDKSDEEIIGIVTECLKLNIRKEPNKDSEVIAVVNCTDNLVIDAENSTDGWYAVATVSGIDGFCMKKFIAIT